MKTKICPRCGHENDPGEETCRNCRSPAYERYVDCTVCGGVGDVQIDYTDAFEQAHPEVAEPILPCGKCDGTGKLLRYKVQSEIDKKRLGRLLMIGLDFLDGITGR